ncbi:helix-turn-helix domain-containing protein [Aliikangiella sp. IMCC44359]|uniref:helix-turn-helix domain-containing protein n=1 Tax=Aliikangiella sp. IMCC44359 TaxID=3459125 RepID=UPI00403B30D7
MTKLLFKYGVILFVALSGFKFLEYQFFSYKITLEIYLFLVGSAFLVIGFIVSQHLFNRAEASSQVDIDEKRLADFTQREQEILVLLSEGYTNKEIAKSLDISPNTVKTHLSSVYDKLAVSNRTQAVAEAKLLKIIK